MANGEPKSYSSNLQLALTILGTVTGMIILIIGITMASKYAPKPHQQPLTLKIHSISIVLEMSIHSFNSSLYYNHSNPISCAVVDAIHLGPKKQSLLKLLFNSAQCGEEQPYVDDWVLEGMKEDEEKGEMSFVVEMKLRVSYRTGILGWDYDLKTDCPKLDIDLIPELSLDFPYAKEILVACCGRSNLTVAQSLHCHLVAPAFWNMGDCNPGRFTCPGVHSILCHREIEIGQAEWNEKILVLIDQVTSDADLYPFSLITVVLSAFDEAVSLDVLDHPALNLIYYMFTGITTIKVKSSRKTIGDSRDSKKKGFEGIGLDLPPNKHGNLISPSSDENLSDCYQLWSLMASNIFMCGVCSQILPAFCKLSNQFPKRPFDERLHDRLWLHS
ncbi:Exocyst subunit exo70 family protein A2 isoform 1 [Hibiscus syriacus]|uniref:Exocyst subunit exo70 family protein A2 isoform 1 n=1 Tax=Hibiscus syriacus TaxID=106335 RepID=A0A6A3CBK0_HIBSY|nr:Exocyst subunit exo70 family protein A2 isoform 1 [Hibiscus syriacus]